MRRREFLGALGAAAARPAATWAEQPAKPPTIGFLGSGKLTAHGHWVAAFLQRLRVLGWIEGRNLVIEYRWAEGSRDRAAVFAADFVRLKADIIVTYAVPMVLAAKHATSTIPIVFAAAADPVGTGLVASLARPGGNRQIDTPKTEQIDLLFRQAVGINKISLSWKWKKMAVTGAAGKLDRYVTMRGDIAHRGKGTVTVKKHQVEDYFDFIKNLATKTGGAVNSYVEQITRRPLWS